MLAALLACSMVLADSTSKDLTRAEYDVARAKTARDADSQVRLALWCEARGLNAERVRHLALAVLADPGHATARGLLGLMRDGALWRRPQDLAARARDDANLATTLAAYNARRAEMPKTAAAHAQLALWCEQNGLNPEATAHWTAVTRIEPSRALAWRKLGYQRQGGRWVTAAQITAERVEAEAQARADRSWIADLANWRDAIGKPAQRDQAERALAGVVDPRAVPAVWRIFVASERADPPRAVQILGQIPARSASRALATLAACAPAAGVRQSAAETLARRDPREYADLLIGMMQDPVRYTVSPVSGPGSPGVLFVEGQRFNLQRLYEAPPALFTTTSSFHGRIGTDDLGRPAIVRGNELNELATLGADLRAAPVREMDAAFQAYVWRQLADRTAAMITELVKVAVSSQLQLESDMAAIDAHNESVRFGNGVIAAFLERVTGRDLGVEPKPWRAWWVNQLGYSYVPDPTPRKPVIVQNVKPSYEPPLPKGFAYNSGRGYQAYSCFGRGTPVITLSGPRPIESLDIGDRVLAQDVRTGTLSYEPVVAVFHNPPAQTLRVTLLSETIVSSEFHRFWKPGVGWVMARDLKPGDSVRTLDGPVRVTAVDSEPVQPVFNLEVAGSKTFFVGRGAALVHDNTLPEPARPFDAAPEIAKR